MASVAEQMAANASWSAFGKAKDLQNRILFALGLLIVYRLGTFIPDSRASTPSPARGIFVEQMQGGILGIFSMFTGNALSTNGDLSRWGSCPTSRHRSSCSSRRRWCRRLRQLKKEGEAGRKKINQYTRYGTVLLWRRCRPMAWPSGCRARAGVTPGPFFIASTVITLVGGTMFLMWLGEQITARGCRERYLAHHLRRASWRNFRALWHSSLSSAGPARSGDPCHHRHHLIMASL